MGSIAHAAGGVVGGSGSVSPLCYACDSAVDSGQWTVQWELTIGRCPGRPVHGSEDEGVLSAAVALSLSFELLRTQS